MVGATFGVLKFPGLCSLVAGTAAAAALVGLVWRQIRGVTGDVCGAVNELSETAFLVVLSGTEAVSFTAIEGVLPDAFWKWHL
jgi:cobalamin synthase